MNIYIPPPTIKHIPIKIFFNEVPKINTLIGMCLIVGGGIYIFIREKAQEQSIATEKPLR